MKLRRLTATVASTAVAALILTGCAGGGGLSNSASTDTSWNKATASLKGVTLTYGNPLPGDPGLKEVMAAFTKATGAKFKLISYPAPYEQSVLTKVATGDKPDLLGWQPTASELAPLQPSKNLLPMTGAPWLSKIDSSVRDAAGIYNKTRYAALVSSPSVIGVYYNKADFAKAGITAVPTSWDEFLADAKLLKSKGIAPIYEAGKDQWPTQWAVQVQLAEAAKAGLWSKINTNTEKFTDPTILNAITQYQGLQKSGLFNSDYKTGTFEAQANALLNGKAGMAVQVNALLLQMQQVASTEKINANVGWFPLSKSGTIATSIPDNKNGVVAFNTGNAKQEAAAKQFLTYWMTTGYAGYVAAEKTVSIEPSVATPTSIPKVGVAIAASLKDSVGSMQSLAVANADLYINLANMLQGTQTPEQVASTTQNQFAQLAQAAGAKGF